MNPLIGISSKNFCMSVSNKKGLSGVKEALEYMKKGFSIALMVDQRVSEGSKIKFFNNNAYTTTLPAQLASRFNYDIVPIYISRTSKDEFEMEILEPIKVSKDKKDDKESITKTINETIEKLILRDPSQWILTHNRWK